ncbi:hypothetical protein FLM9_1300 [Candidatus Synechococcus spongiarum]|uniref:Uncharacterized protein n=1 Tax=Candidatus Synechococcus spongiarum TaxID=431041 RepID=A0A164ZS95_9SYNE|nr:hypothetical protein FLM9_1300 [Candidatus Synechococcus spongiarum]
MQGNRKRQAILQRGERSALLGCSKTCSEVPQPWTSALWG